MAWTTSTPGVASASVIGIPDGVVTTAKIADNAVTFAKLQNIATQRVVGRNTAGTGDPEEVTVSQVLDWLGSANRGDIIRRGASAWETLNVGSSGQVLTSDGADPAWTAPVPAAQIWEQIGDSGSLGTVAQVEFTFVAGRYSAVVVNISDVVRGGTITLSVTLRHSGGAIVTLTSAASDGTATTTGHADFAVGLIDATKRHVGRLLYFQDDNADATAQIIASGANAAAPDRVRVAPSSGNINAGRVMAYGLRATFP